MNALSRKRANRFAFGVVILINAIVLWWALNREPPKQARSDAPVVQEFDVPPTEVSVSAPDKALTTRELLESHVQKLANEIGERNVFHPEALTVAADHIEASLMQDGYQVVEQVYQVRDIACRNIIVERKGAGREDAEIILVGAHYDSVRGSPGANDNASGVAALLVLANAFKDLEPEKTLRFVAFVNEEPPFFQKEFKMGSLVYAQTCRERHDKIAGVISLETMGYYDDAPGSQKYPALLSNFYPDTGNFIGFVSNLQSREFANQVADLFAKHCEFPHQRGAFPESLDGVGWSDQWSFWQQGYVGIMVTDTAPFRYPHYHKPSDTVEKVDFARLTQVVEGLVLVVRDLVIDPN